ncbi:MAG: ECF-type sigma factor [Thermoanaerobaculia bacterium]
MIRPPLLPYVVGQWVRGDRFYGRRAQLAEILEGQRDSLWLVGTRRIGKTSFLRHAEWLTASSPERGYLPLFWDLQGASEPKELHLSFHDALLDSEERWAEAGVSVSSLDPADLFDSLARVRRQVRGTGRRLLLLCDEAEELIELQGKDQSLLPKLRRAVQSTAEVRIVLASTIRLWRLAEQSGDTSPFLHGFTPALYLATLTGEEALALVLQEHLPREARPTLLSEVAQGICHACGNQPYLLHIVAKKYMELGDLEEAIDLVRADQMVSHFFSVDFRMLNKEEQEVLQALGELGTVEREALENRIGVERGELNRSLLRLENLGFVSRSADRSSRLANDFIRHWLKTLSPREPELWSSDHDSTAFSQKLTEILTELEQQPAGAGASPEELLDRVYEELRGLAHRYMGRERTDHTLQPTALVHEAYLRLVDQSRVDWQGRTHFFAMGARMMRRVLIDHARGRGRAKRGGEWLQISWAEELFANPKGLLSSEQMIDLDRAIEELTALDERQARVVELRYFAGMTVEEVAQILGVSKRTVESDWAAARDWLKERLRVRQ